MPNDAAVTLETFTQQLTTYLEPAQVIKVKRAYFYAEQAHMGQMRRSGEAYITHPLAVANILAHVCMDYQTIIAALLHDVIEDCNIGKTAITQQFGETVAELVDGVSKLAKVEYKTQADKQAENFSKMLLAMSKDLRVVVIKLSDRLHNIRTLASLRPDKKRRIAKETLEIYARLAQRLGMNDWRIEFEDRCFKAIHYLRAERLEAALQHVRGNRKSIVESIKLTIEQRLQHNHIKHLVIGREKHLYSIYQKMRDKHKSFKEIMDVYAFRIIVDDIDTCYRVLGCIHGLYKPVSGEFKDYIAIPKGNGYQSLHTVVYGKQGLPIEVQIRTKEMDILASSGVAAHWLYKTPSNEKDSHTQTTENVDRANRWIKRLIEIKQHTNDSIEFVENVKLDLLKEEVYVFTPKGEIIELANGASSVDFAYAVHTDIGNRCIACRINDRPAPLSQKLESGQKVQILVSEKSQPNPNWLNFVVTAKARSAIRHHLKKQQNIHAVELGKRMLEHTLRKETEELINDQLKTLLEQTQTESMEQLFEAIGLGHIPTSIAAKALKPETNLDADMPSTLVIGNTNDILINYARCCCPIPGDAITGHLSKDKGVVIHQEICRNVAELRNKHETIIATHWAKEISGEFSVDLAVEVKNDRGITAALVNRLTRAGANLDRLYHDDRDAEHSVIILSIGVTNRIHLANVMRSVRTMHSVQRIYRANNPKKSR